MDRKKENYLHIVLLFQCVKTVFKVYRLSVVVIYVNYMLLCSQYFVTVAVKHKTTKILQNHIVYVLYIHLLKYTYNTAK